MSSFIKNLFRPYLWGMQWTPLQAADQQRLEQLGLFQMAQLDHEGKPLCVARLEDGLYAINNRCPHAGAPLHKGGCNKKGVVTCPLHGYKFDVKSGRSTDGSDYKLSHYRFKTEDGILYIGRK